MSEKPKKVWLHLVKVVLQVALAAVSMALGDAVDAASFILN